MGNTVRAMNKIVEFKDEDKGKDSKGQQENPPGGRQWRALFSDKYSDVIHR
jgi:hypothetical protein